MHNVGHKIQGCQEEEKHCHVNTNKPKNKKRITVSLLFRSGIRQFNYNAVASQQQDVIWGFALTTCWKQTAPLIFCRTCSIIAIPLFDSISIIKAAVGTAEKPPFERQPTNSQRVDCKLRWHKMKSDTSNKSSKIDISSHGMLVVQSDYPPRANSFIGENNPQLGRYWLCIMPGRTRPGVCYFCIKWRLQTLDYSPYSALLLKAKLSVCMACALKRTCDCSVSVGVRVCSGVAP